MSDLKKVIASSILWQMFERLGTYFIQFFVSIIVARLLTPNDYGLVALLIIFIQLSDVFVDGGFRNALIQRKEMSDIDCSSVFWLNILVGMILAGILFFSAPMIASFYDNSLLIPIMRVFSFLPLIDSLAIVHNALIFKHFLFKLNFKIRWISMLVSGIVAIVMAYYGYGVWALVAQRMTSAILVVVSMWFWVKWFPKLKLSFVSLYELFKYGSKLLIASLLQSFCNDAFSLIVGKIYMPTSLALYNRGNAYPRMIISSLETSLSNVMFSAFSKLQDEKEKICSLMRKGVSVTMFLSTPLLTSIFITAGPLIRILLTTKWSGAIVFLQIACLNYLFFPLLNFQVQIIRATGHSGLNLLLQIIKNILMFVFIFLTYRWGVVAMALGLAINTLLCVFWSSCATKKLIDYGLIRQMQDIFPTFMTAVGAAVVSYSIQIVGTNDWFKLIVGNIAFFAVYIGINVLLMTKPITLTMNMIRSYKCTKA